MYNLNISAEYTTIRKVNNGKISPYYFDFPLLPQFVPKRVSGITRDCSQSPDVYWWSHCYSYTLSDMRGLECGPIAHTEFFLFSF